MRPVSIIPLLAATAFTLPSLPIHSRGENETVPFSIPSEDQDSRSRASALDTKRQGWSYGSFPLGVAPLPAGDLAEKAMAEEYIRWLPDTAKGSTNAQADEKIAKDALLGGSNFTSLDDYKRLHDGLWQVSLPGGVFDGMQFPTTRLTNYTDDRMFSMMRLSASPYRVRRVKPEDTLLFDIENAASITGLSQKELQSQGRLFSIDYSDLKDQASSGLYGAGCQAYFYISATSGDFLPLAIKAIFKGKEDKALVYTPEDSADDWMLAKLMFNSNDNWHCLYSHVVYSHAAAEGPYLAAIRAFSDDHPILAVMRRYENTPWGIRPALWQNVVTSKQVDSYYPWTGYAAGNYSNKVCKSEFSSHLSGEAGNFTSNYIKTNLENRGLINSDFGPALKKFPFWEDCFSVVDNIRDFMRSFIYSYYDTDMAIVQDNELQDWAAEAQVAKVPDFPTKITSREQVVEMLTHHAYLGTVVHSVLSTDGSVGDTVALPFAPSAFWKPLPTEKGATNIIQYMPQVDAAIYQVAILAAVNRPFWKDSNQTMSHMFDDAAMLRRMNRETNIAAANYRKAQNNFSEIVRARKFDSDGLMNGLPFAWKVLDPNWAPYWSTV
ncbi:lipoxygenase [Xylariaceae sp. FL1272]|nr:lipoxygenase [Xylariaceae sp. FL1272]